MIGNGLHSIPLDCRGELSPQNSQNTQYSARRTVNECPAQRDIAYVTPTTARPAKEQTSTFGNKERPQNSQNSPGTERRQRAARASCAAIHQIEESIRGYNRNNAIESLIPGDLKRTGSTNGGEWHGPCPRCGGRDRLVCWPTPVDGRAPCAWCRRCGRPGTGDALDWAIHFSGMDPSHPGARAAFLRRHGYLATGEHALGPPQHSHSAWSRKIAVITASSPHVIDDDVQSRGAIDRAKDTLNATRVHAPTVHQAEAPRSRDDRELTLDEPERYLARDKSSRPCYACGSMKWVRALDAPANFWNCARCSPPPEADSDRWVWANDREVNDA